MLYLVSAWRKVMRSFLSLPFFRPPKAILVPGMYFLGFSRYSNCGRCQRVSRPVVCPSCTHEGVLVPLNALLLIGVRVGEALDLTSVAAEKTVKVGADLVALALLQVVALCAAGLEEVGTLLLVTFDDPLACGVSRTYRRKLHRPRA